MGESAVLHEVRVDCLLSNVALLLSEPTLRVLGRPGRFDQSRVPLADHRIVTVAAQACDAPYESRNLSGNGVREAKTVKDAECGSVVVGADSESCFDR